MPPLNVPTIQVFDQIVNAQSTGVIGLQVTATLTSAVTQTISPAGVVVPTSVSVTTDVNGFWALNLVPNDNISPANTLYTISAPGMISYQISLPTSGPATRRSGALIVGAATVLSPVPQSVGPLTVNGDLTIAQPGNLTAILTKQTGVAADFVIRNGTGGGGIVLRPADNSANDFRADVGGLLTATGPLKIPPSFGGTMAPTNYGTVLVKIAETVVSVATGSVTFSSIPNGFGHLITLAQSISDTAATVGGVLRANGDTGTNYNRVEITQSGTASNVTGGGVAATNAPDFYTVTGNTAGISEAALMLIANYARTTLFKFGVSVAGGVDGASTPAIRIKAWNWGSTVAINSLTFFPTSNNFGIGTVLSLYGVP